MIEDKRNCEEIIDNTLNTLDRCEKKIKDAMELCNQKKYICNLGCGDDMYGDVRVDIFKTKAMTLQWDIEKPLPIPDNTFDEVYSKNVFEHMKNPFNLLMEMKRICKVGGRIKIITDNGNFIFYLWNFIGLKHGEYRVGDSMRPDDMHYMFFQNEHLNNYFYKAGIKVISNKLLPNIYCKRDRNIQKIISFFIGKNLGMPHIEIIGEKEKEEKNETLGTSASK